MIQHQNEKTANNTHLSDQRTEVADKEQMKAGAGATDKLKETDQMKWVGLMNNLKACAEEIVLKELVYS